MSTDVGMSSCCLSGKVQTGKPTGRETTVGGLNTYVAEPSDSATTRSIVFLTDIFGWRFNNVRLLADSYAKAGFYCYIPDLHEGDSLPEEFLQDVEPPLPVRESLSITEKGVKTAKVGATFGPWLLKHREGVVKPLVSGFLGTIRKTPGTDKVGVIGFCWGGRYAILAAHENGLERNVDAAYACHPSLVSIPSDFEQVVKPLSLAVGDKDSLLGQSEIEKIKGILDEKKDLQTEIKVYEDQVHGFSLRGDFSSDKDKKAMDDAEKQGVEWFKKWLS